MSDIPSFPYALLWEERELVSVANLTRGDATSYFAAPEHCSVHANTTVYPLEKANEALADLREGRLFGAAVLRP